MSRRKSGHTGQTTAGHTRDVKVERIGKVTIYKRGGTYYLYYRENNRSRRDRIEGNLAAARATASDIQAALSRGQRSPLGYDRTSPAELAETFLDYVAHTKELALRTRDRYRAALSHFVTFCEEAEIRRIDAIDLIVVEEFVGHLRGRRRTRNGATKGKQAPFKPGGIWFILSTCRTAFHWAAKHRLLPPYSPNPFSEFPIDDLADRGDSDNGPSLLTPSEQREFFRVCDSWQLPIFKLLVTYGLRVGELTHLLVDDVDFAKGEIRIRSKPWLFWNVKTRRRRSLPITEETKAVLKQLIGKRKAGFVIRNESFFRGTATPPVQFRTQESFQTHLEKIAAAIEDPDTDRQQRRQQKAVVAFCRQMGQVPEKRVRTEFIALAKAIGRSDLTRIHDLRHLFASRAQELGMNPLMVQEILGHASLEMTRQYTQFGTTAKREALSRLAADGRGDGREA